MRRAAAIAIGLAMTACGGGEAGRTLRVPAEFKTIQAAVDASRPGDLVAISPGVYRESVVVDDEHERIVVRGLDRNRVVLDGGDRLGDGIAVHAGGVAVENLTVRRYAVDGIVWSPAAEYGSQRQLQGWRGSYITASDNGLYGVYAFGSEHGRFDHVYASGHPDSGVYVGRCDPCHALVRDSVAEHNHVGYEATNASGDVTVTANVWRRNRVGVEINSLRKEAAFPQHDSLLADNTIADNQDRRAPRGSTGFGAGVVINGGRGNTVRGNRISGHVAAGVVVLDSQDAAASDNTISANQLAGNAVDLALQTRGSQGNCFTGNRLRSTTPAALQSRTAHACGKSVALPPGRLTLAHAPPQVDYRSVPAPAAQPNMPSPARAPARPASGRPEKESP